MKFKWEYFLTLYIIKGKKYKFVCAKLAIDQVTSDRLGMIFFLLNLYFIVYLLYVCNGNAPLPKVIGTVVGS